MPPKYTASETEMVHAGEYSRAKVDVHLNIHKNSV
jgi:hypothetical protein